MGQFPCDSVSCIRLAGSTEGAANLAGWGFLDIAFHHLFAERILDVQDNQKRYEKQTKERERFIGYKNLCASVFVCTSSGGALELTTARK
mmetsp:Transcript_28953/g.70601  ORF Transcript_28953/g.70601 Transcript_28953/m.70601 type:complete len:90 (-) Transcript_28953:359-628(-)